SEPFRRTRSNVTSPTNALKPIARRSIIGIRWRSRAISLYCRSSSIVAAADVAGPPSEGSLITARLSRRAVAAQAGASLIAVSVRAPVKATRRAADDPGEADVSHFPQPRYVPCDSCGQPVPREELERHACDRERWLDYQIVALRPQIRRVERDFAAWLETPAGRFEQFYARRP